MAPGSEAASEAALQTASQALELFGELYAPYPYADYRVAETEFAGGMEYSGLTFLGALLRARAGMRLLADPDEPAELRGLIHSIASGEEHNPYLTLAHVLAWRQDIWVREHLEEHGYDWVREKVENGTVPA